MSLWLLLGSAGIQHKSRTCPSGSPLLLLLTLPWLTEEGNAKQPGMGYVEPSGKPEVFLYLPSKKQKVFSEHKANAAGQCEGESGTTSFPTVFLPDGFDVLHILLEELL